MLRIYSQSLGCPKTRVDTERLLGSLGPVVTVDLPEQADLVFINTCAFIAPAVQESVQAVVEMIEDIGSLPRGKRPFLAVAGCLPEKFADELFPSLTEGDVFLGCNDADKLLASIERSYAENGRIKKLDFLCGAHHKKQNCRIVYPDGSVCERTI